MRFSKIIFIFMILVITAQGIIIVRWRVEEKKNIVKLSEMRGQLNQAVSENANLRNLVRIKEKQNIIIVDERAADVLRQDLIKNAKVINVEGVKGGSMNFYDENGIKILNNKWVLAKFDDGHITGEILLEYTIDDNKKINWRKIASYIEK